MDECRSIASKAGISSMPTFQFMKGGEKVAQVMGAAAGPIEAAIVKHMAA